MASNPRIPKAEIRGVRGRLLKSLSRRMLGQVPEPAYVYWHNRTVLKDTAALGRKAERWDACDETLKAYAHMAVAALVGCSWCLDYGYYSAHTRGLDEAKAREVPRWRESDVFSPLERDVMEYAEAMSRTPTTVTDDLFGRVLGTLGPAAMVELTAWIGMANLATRGNTALGIESQGLSKVCALPLAEPVEVSPG